MLARAYRRWIRGGDSRGDGRWDHHIGHLRRRGLVVIGACDAERSAQELHPVERQRVRRLLHGAKLEEGILVFTSHRDLVHARARVQREVGGLHDGVEELLKRLRSNVRRQIPHVQPPRPPRQRSLLREHRRNHRLLLRCHGTHLRGLVREHHRAGDVGGEGLVRLHRLALRVHVPCAAPLPLPLRALVCTHRLRRRVHTRRFPRGDTWPACVWS